MAAPNSPPPTTGEIPTGPMGPPDPSMIPAVISPYAQTLGHGFVAVTLTLNVIAFVLFAGRIWTRSFPQLRLQWDDLIFAIAYCLVVVDSGLLLATCPWVFWKDPNTVTLADIQDAFKLALIAQPLWSWSMAAIKIGIAAMLLRLQQEQNWRRFLWAMIVLQVVIGIYNTFSQLLQCIPLHAAWDFLGLVEARCWSDYAIRTSSIVVSSFNVATDVIFSLIPITFLRKVQRPIRERIIIGILMALGLFAAAASIAKIVAASEFGKTGDATAEGISVGMWSCIEELVAFIAASIPCLKSPFQRVLVHFNLVSAGTKRPTYGGYNNGYGNMGDNTHGSKTATSPTDAYHSAIKMKSMRSTDTDGHSTEIILAGDGFHDGNKNPEIWCTTELRMQEERMGSLSGRGLEGQRKTSAKWSDDTHSDDEKWGAEKGKFSNAV